MTNAIEQVVVNAQQMREIEERMFAAGMPVAALMEKVAGLITNKVATLYPLPKSPARGLRVGVLVGPGHNGGDALVVAQELYYLGYEVIVYCPFTKLKQLTAQHSEYVDNLGISSFTEIESLESCDLFIDGLFGFGLDRNLSNPVASAIDKINQWSKPIISIDVPSGLHTDTGEVLGTAIRATHTLCLGLWKQGLLQDHAIDYIGNVELIDFDIPQSDIEAVLSNSPRIRRLTKEYAQSHLPLTRPPVTHKYKMGHLLLVCGSSRYAGGAILTGLGARASGVGMLSIAVPATLKPLLVSHLPEALIIGCAETEDGAISHLPEDVDLNDYDAIACGPGLTKSATSVVETILDSNTPLLLDADGLNIIAQMGTIPVLSKREALTILTPHTGEFKRLFTDTPDPMKDRISAVRSASFQSKAVVLLKGARTAIAHPHGDVWINPESTPALARGGSGDVLTGLIGGLVAYAAKQQIPVEPMVAAGAWWHAQAGILAAKERTELGVDAFTLTQYLIPVARQILN